VTLSVYYTGFNMLDPVVGGLDERGRKLRRAIAIALDFEEYISIFANGRGIPAQSPLPPGIPGHRDGAQGIDPYVYDWVDGAPRRKSIDAARRLLAEAGWPGGRDARTGEPLVLYFEAYTSGPDDKARLDWLRKQFRQLGIQLVVRATDYNRFRDKMRKGSGQIFQWGWNADYPDPENFLFLLYGPNGKTEHGGENAANYANPDFDRLFDKMKNLADGPRRQAYIEEMLAIVRKDAPWAWGYHPVSYSLSHAWLKFRKPNLMAHNTLKYQAIDAAQRHAMRRKWNPPVLWPIYLLAGLTLAALIPALRIYRARERETAR
jgi:ABC-type transport system substrate-binding protein